MFPVFPLLSCPVSSVPLTVIWTEYLVESVSQSALLSNSDASHHMCIFLTPCRSFDVMSPHLQVPLFTAGSVKLTVASPVVSHGGVNANRDRGCSLIDTYHVSIIPALGSVCYS